MLRLETRRLVLEQIGLKHEAGVHRLHNDPFVVNAMFDGVFATSEQTEERMRVFIEQWEQLGFGYWAVYEKRDDGEHPRFVGRSGLKYLDDTDRVELGHCYVSDAAGRGIAPEAGLEVIRFGLEVAKLDKVVAVVRPENRRAIKAVEKVGFRYIDDRIHYNKLMRYFEVTAEDLLAARAA